VHTGNTSKECPECKLLGMGYWRTEEEEKVRELAVNNELKSLVDKYAAQIKGHEREIKDYQRQIDSSQRMLSAAEASIREKQAIVDALKGVLPTGSYRGERFFVASRTRKDGPGHFIEMYRDGTSKCSCEGGRYGGACWAQTHVKNNLQESRLNLAYPYDHYNFDNRLRPLSYETWLPKGINRLYR
jgi:hypothetical protein